MLHRNLLFIGVVTVLAMGSPSAALAGSSSPKTKNTISATSTADCKGYSIAAKVEKSSSTQKLYTKYSLVLTCGGQSTTYSDQSYSKDTTVNFSGNWLANGSLTSECSLTGAVTLSDGSTTLDSSAIVINKKSTATLKCTADCTGQVGDFVWNDLNTNGLQDDTEPGINGVTVNLLDGSGKQVATTVTSDKPSGYSYPGPNPHGYYQFSGLCAGNYQVAVPYPQSALDGFEPTLSMAGNTSKDSNGSPAFLTLPKSGVDETIDFGYRTSSPIKLSCPADKGSANKVYSSSLVASGGASPYKFSIVSGGLPDGLSLSPNTGLISGTPESFGSFRFTAKVVDSTGKAAGTTEADCTIKISSLCTIPGVTISKTSWNSFNIPGGTKPVVWVHAHIGKPSGIPSTKSEVLFTGAAIALDSKVYSLPDGLIIFDPSAPKTIVTNYDSKEKRWETTVNPSYFSDEMFFTGAAIPVDASIAGGAKATLTFTVQTDNTKLAFQWQWSAAVFTFWPPDWNDAKIQPFHDSEHAGTPMNPKVQQSLIQGPRGGGGSNFTGSWSATGAGACPN